MHPNKNGGKPAAKLQVTTPTSSYPIYIGSGLLQRIGAYLGETPVISRIEEVLLVSNETVYPLYGGPVEQALEQSGRRVHTFVMPDGEQHKSWDMAERILSYALKRRLSRKTLVIALGGGVVGDLAGFAAAVYLRGVPLVQIPTTLLAQVDSSIGGKVAVNHPLGKNMIGAFHRPELVLADAAVLSTLPRRELIAGLAEVIKYGIIWDEHLFSFLEANAEAVLACDPECLEAAIRRSCEIKAEIVAKDERDQGLRAILNFGHTVGHALENVTGYTAYRHGEAVAVGMAAACRLGTLIGCMSQEEAERVIRLLERYGLPVKLPAEARPHIPAAMMHDKKAVGDQLWFVIPNRIGEVGLANFGRDYDWSLLEEALDSIVD
ncbi:MAG TPA: 3-dehydroquinate synthase [Limnochordia bacterium]|nr:3-dehydroquinate synthase [Limnochordia bacterium]HPT92970.1 3-dehydroquinate synthase [Limnochordia bacterium]HXK96384.1 3-dehydroquinate synthase [Limnochordia bacterium]